MTNPFQLQLFNPISESYENAPERIVKERTGTFTDNMKLPIHRWFRYSAGFSADWVEQVIASLEPKVILDPFAGSGTVCVAADKLGVKSYGVEAHPFVHKLAEGKIAWAADINEFLEAVNELKQSAAILQPKLPEKLPILLCKCYTQETLKDLFKIRQAYLELAPSLSKKLQSLIFLAICAILRSTSHVGTAQWQYVLPNKRKAKTSEPFDALERQIAMMRADMLQMQSITVSSLSTIVREDARSLRSLSDNSIDLVITSPPYANNYDYADAWRRYTKHSKNKAQEIQGAILPIIELHQLSAPFYGAILAGDFTKPALDQLRNNGFSIIYIPYKDVVAAFKEIDFDIAFDEETPDKNYTEASRRLANLTTSDKDRLRQALMRVSKREVDNFMDTLRNCLERYITKIIILPLFGTRHEFESIDDAITGLDALSTERPNGEFEKFEVIVDYSNSDTIRASFQTKTLLSNFLSKLVISR